MRLWKHENRGRARSDSGQEADHGSMHGMHQGRFDAERRGRMADAEKPDRGFAPFGMDGNDRTARRGCGGGGTERFGRPRHGGRLKGPHGRMDGGFVQAGAGCGPMDRGGGFDDGTAFSPVRGSGRGMGGGRRGMGRTGRGVPMDGMSAGGQTAHGAGAEPANHAETRAATARLSYPAAGPGTCPLCRNHCSLSNPGCSKGEAYGRSLNAEALR